MANLTLAQPLFDKYRDNPLARKLFAIHNWEFTYLCELLRQAKRQGKVGHWEFMWLKPMSRVMFYSLQNMGMKTPCAENAAVFNQYLYERGVARLNRLPLRKVRLKDGDTERLILEPVVFLSGAISGLRLEWERWMQSSDDPEDLWKSKDVWRSVNASLNEQYAQIADQLSRVTDVPAEDSEFDRVQSLARERANAEFSSGLRNEIRLTEQETKTGLGSLF